MSSSNEWMPTKGEFLTAGILGIILYLSLAGVATYILRKGLKSKTCRRFFACVIIMSALELPRYLELTAAQSYQSRICYAFHILAGTFFFVSFSIVCYQWAGLLQLGTYVKMIYSMRGLMLANAAFAAIDIASVVMCLASSSLQAYFDSTAYEIFTFIEGLRNVTYSTFLAYYGCTLLTRFYHFSTVERSTRSESFDNRVFAKAVKRITMILTLCCVCFILRVCMLCVKMAALFSNSTVTSTHFRLFGVGWFICADFIPRVLPTMAFILLMKTKPLGRKSIYGGTQGSMDGRGSGGVNVMMKGGPRKGGGFGGLGLRLHSPSKSDDFQFVKLAGDEEESRQQSQEMLAKEREMLDDQEQALGMGIWDVFSDDYEDEMDEDDALFEVDGDIDKLFAVPLDVAFHRECSVPEGSHVII
jgi:hypothetical protein